MAHDLPLTGFYAQTAFRYSNYDTPFWARNNTTSGRWHVRGDGATQYLSLHPDAAWADLARHENLRGEAELAEVRMQMWVVTFSQEGIVNYSTFEQAEEAGFPPDALIDDAHERCQDEGRRLRKEGYAGVVAPSAALPGALSVTLFGRRVRATYGTLPRLTSTIPASIVAIGRPAPGLTARVRYFGDVHPDYEAYRTEVAARPLQAEDDSGDEPASEGDTS